MVRYESQHVYDMFFLFQNQGYICDMPSVACLLRRMIKYVGQILKELVTYMGKFI